MDPVSAFSIACGLLTVADCGIKVASYSRKILAGEGIRDDLTEASKEFHRVYESLQNTLEGTSAATAATDEEKALHDLSKKCNMAALKLQQELDKVILNETTGKMRWLKSLGKSIVGVWNAKRVEELERDFKACKEAVNTRILIDLR